MDDAEDFASYHQRHTQCRANARAHDGLTATQLLVRLRIAGEQPALRQQHPLNDGAGDLHAGVVLRVRGQCDQIFADGGVSEHDYGGVGGQQAANLGENGLTKGFEIGLEPNIGK